MKRINLIDCPGIVPPNMNDTPEDILLRGVVRIENVEYPSHYIEALMGKVKRHHLERTYELKGWEDYISFLEMLARKGGRLLKGGEPDVEGVAKIVVHDFLRGKIPWFTPPPMTDAAADGSVVQGRDGRLGEMPKKRKRDDGESLATSAPSKDEDDDEDEFGGFEEDESSDSQPDVENEDSVDDDEGNDRISLGSSSEEEVDSDDDGGDAKAAEEQLLGDGDASSASEDGGAPVVPDGGGRPKRRRK